MVYWVSAAEVGRAGLVMTWWSGGRVQDGAPADVDVGPPPGAARVGVDVTEPPGSSLMINSGSLARRSLARCTSANFTSYDRHGSF